MSDIFFLQDSRGLVGENMMFWGNGGGYTSDLRQAEPFTKENAVAQNQCRETDIPWPADYLQARFYATVDMQHLRHVDRNSRDVAFYRQLPGQYIGNDIVWEAQSGVSTDLLQARVFGSMLPGAIMWPVEEMQKIARPVVRACDVSIKDALAGTGVVLHKPKRIPREVFNCYQCGRFIGEDKRYFDCPNCGGDNRP